MKKIEVKPTLQQRRAFCIFQLVRLVNRDPIELEKLTTNELEKLERKIYHDKYDSFGKSEYTPMINP